MAIYDAMQFVKPDVRTICYGIAMSMGALLLAGGAKGKRMALPNSRILIHQPSGGFEGVASDIEIHARETLDLRDRLDAIYAKHTGKSKKQVHEDMERDRFFKAERGGGVRPDRPGDRAARARAAEDRLLGERQPARPRVSPGPVEHPLDVLEHAPEAAGESELPDQLLDSADQRRRDAVGSSANRPSVRVVLGRSRIEPPWCSKGALSWTIR